jgi:ABC-type glycerol-3-phosphate transport system substrate-binding protein
MRKILPLATLAALLFAGAGCLPAKTPAAPGPVTLEYWRLDDAPEALDATVAAYVKLHPHVTVKVTRLDRIGYERTLLEAFAEGRGPDIFNAPSHDLRAWRGKIAPLPAETTIAAQAVDAKKNIVWTTKKTPGMSVRELRDAFVETVATDVVWSYAEKEDDQPTDRIWGLPFSLDSLALFYNRDLLRKASVAEPPAFWTEFQQAVTKLTVRGADGRILVAGAAIGGGANVAHGADLLAAIMGQNGALLSDASGTRFDEHTDRSAGRPNPPAVDPVVFYQGFATEGNAAYCWNAAMPGSLDAFGQGRAAMFFGLPSDRELLRERSPKLDFGIAPLPQIETSYKYNVADYPVEVVAKSTAHPNEAWDFLQFAARAENAAGYLEATGRPAALRSLLDAQAGDPDIGAFSQQALTARTWYLGENYATAATAMENLIAWRPTAKDANFLSAIRDTVSAINAAYRRSY